MRKLLSAEENPGYKAEDDRDPSIKLGGSVSYLSVILVGIAVVIVGASFFYAESAIQEAALFALAAVFGIFARIAQAQKHHSELMDRLNR